jgi:hypothetical protein
MALPIKLPAKNATPTKDHTEAVKNGLTSVIVGHPQAVQPYTFYEVLDEWLGPWGNAGYPIGYGKFYCIVFTTNEHLNENPQAREWVQNTTALLQEILRDYVVERFEKGTLSTISKEELRDYAFKSHPKAYTEGGLTLVVMLEPQLIPVIMTIPGAEFDPRSDNFGPTIKQVLATISIVAPEVAGYSLAGLAGPAHTGLFARAARKDQRRLLDFQATVRQLDFLKKSVQSGKVDHIPLLNKITDRLNATRFENPDFARQAREIIMLANQRKRALAKTYERMVKDNQEIRSRLNQQVPGWSEWL